MTNQNNYTHLQPPTKGEIFKKIWSSKDFEEKCFTISRCFMIFFAAAMVVWAIWSFVLLCDIPDNPPYMTENWKHMSYCVISLLGAAVMMFLVGISKGAFKDIGEWVLGRKWPSDDGR